MSSILRLKGRDLVDFHVGFSAHRKDKEPDYVADTLIAGHRFRHTLLGTG